MIIECELIGDFYDTEKEFSNSVALMRLVKTLAGVDVMECTFYKRDTIDTTKFHFSSKTLV